VVIPSIYGNQQRISAGQGWRSLSGTVHTKYNTKRVEEYERKRERSKEKRR